MKQKGIIRLMMILFALIQVLVLNAQSGELRGKVVGKDSKEPLPYSTVRIFNDTIRINQTQTDVEGKFTFKDLKPGSYRIEIYALSYEKKVINNVVIESSKINFIDGVMIPRSLELKEVKVEKYKRPVVDKDEGSSIRTYKETMVSDMYLSKSPEDVKPGIINFPDLEKPSVQNKNLAGILTAGVLNDFSKWELWEDINQNDFKTWSEYWKFRPMERYAVQVVSENGYPVPDCSIKLIDKKNNVVWTSRTDNTGKTELWANIYSDSKYNKGYSIDVSWKGNNYNNTKVLKFSNGINIITIPAGCGAPSKVDVMFVVDATGSMGDEIEYLKSELSNIILEVKNKNIGLDINLGSVFYRDKGDAYITRKSDFNSQTDTTINFIKKQSAAGGGDEPEAVHMALNVAIREMKWSDSAIARLMFLVLDAPPHYTPGIIDSLQTLIKEAAAKGIRIIPITGSGINKSAEYLMRAFALATNGTYVFLTDHSHVGNPHIKPTTDEYDVELLKDVLLHLFAQYLFVPSCNKPFDLADMKITDTMYVKNPKIIAHEIADSILVGKFNGQIGVIDTNRVSFVNKPVVVNLDKPVSDSHSLMIELDTQRFNNFRYYPNPTSGKITIDIDGNIDDLYLADISGKLLERYHVKNTKTLEINIGKYPVGIYFLQYFYNNKWLIGKVVLSR